MTIFREQVPAHLMKTYQAVSPRRPATCEQAGCQAYLYGWQTVVPADSPQAVYIRKASGRGFTETRDEAGLAVFTFEPGQRCFASDRHTVPWEGRERFFERGGDLQRNAGGRREHVRAGDWVDSFANNMISVKELAERG